MKAKIESEFEILDFLLSKGRVTYQTIAYEFNVSVNTVKKYIYKINLRYPINFYCGKGGGIEINKSMTLGGRYWTRAELKVIYDSLIEESIRKPEKDDLAKIIKKFDTIGLEDDREHIQKH